MGPEICDSQIVNKYVRLQQSLKAHNLTLSALDYDFLIEDLEDLIHYRFSSIEKIEGFLLGLEYGDRLK